MEEINKSEIYQRKEEIEREKISLVEIKKTRKLSKKERKNRYLTKHEKAELANFLEIGDTDCPDNEFKIVFHPDFNFNEQFWVIELKHSKSKKEEESKIKKRKKIRK